MRINAIQSKIARVYLGWSKSDLAKHSGVSLSTVSSLENGFIPRPKSMARIRAVLEAHGIVFDDERGIVLPADRKVQIFNLPKY